MFFKALPLNVKTFRNPQTPKSPETIGCKRDIENMLPLSTMFLIIFIKCVPFWGTFCSTGMAYLVCFIWGEKTKEDVKLNCVIAFLFRQSYFSPFLSACFCPAIWHCCGQSPFSLSQHDPNRLTAVLQNINLRSN